jgi:hypothetical protein
MAGRMARRNATRLVAALALVAVAAGIVVLVSSRDDGDDSGRIIGVRIGTVDGGEVWSAGDHVQTAGRPGADPVRNATPQPGWRSYAGPVPIFRYHAVDEVPAGEAYPELFVEPADFRAQMDWLQAHGYEAVDLRTVERAWFKGGTLPRKPVVLSFDGVEGELDSVVFGDLSRRGWPAVVVLDGKAPLERRGAIARLLTAGWEVAATGADPAASRRRLEAELKTRVPNFSFPPEASDDPDVAAVEAAGYAGATVTGAGFATSSDRYEMPRITVFGLSGVDGFAEAMRSRGEGVGA